MWLSDIRVPAGWRLRLAGSQAHTKWCVRAKERHFRMAHTREELEAQLVDAKVRLAMADQEAGVSALRGDD